MYTWPIGTYYKIYYVYTHTYIYIYRMDFSDFGKVWTCSQPPDVHLHQKLDVRISSCRDDPFSNMGGAHRAGWPYWLSGWDLKLPGTCLKDAHLWDLEYGLLSKRKTPETLRRDFWRRSALRFVAKRVQAASSCTLGETCHDGQFDSNRDF